MKVCGFIGQIGISLPKRLEDIIKQDLKKVAFESSIVYVGFYGSFQNFVVRELLKIKNRKCKIVCFVGYDGEFRKAEIEYLNKSYDKVIKLPEFDMINNINTHMQNLCTDIYYFFNPSMGNEISSQYCIFPNTKVIKKYLSYEL